ncbi:MAG TPA: type II secretion system protein GspG [Planctomycetaceae bacterium]|nr:type II secretion system protein GspG [Planctomycetaceae bacterium]
MKRSRRQPRRRGFTLTEVLLVLAILGVIAAMVVPNLIGQQGKANIMASKASIKGLEDAMKQYAVSNDGEFPQGARDEVFALLLNPGQDADGRTVAPYLEKTPKDAWDQPLYYEYPTSKVPNGTRPAIWSSGKNRQNEDGGGDDVNNWTETQK